MAELITRHFSVEGQNPLDSVTWEKRVHKDRTIEVPTTWSDRAGRVVADKYMRGVRDANGVVQREYSVRQVLQRVCGTIARWAFEQKTLSAAEAEILRDELLVLTVSQRMAFNSPVWFNVGVTGGKQGTEQCSACFINSVEDNMEDILDLGVREGKIYKHGSGSGVNYSGLRSSRELLSTTGTASGPVPFVAKDDSNAGAIKSGGTTRRAAKMVILNADHGDIMEFAVVKQLVERMARVLIDAGFSVDFRDRFGVYGMLPFQNGNHSIRVTNEFMNAVRSDGTWDLRARDGKVLETIKARALWDAICIAAHDCGDPGLQFDSTINGWHTCSNTDRINASNPCSEYMFLDDSACNLASLNLRKFQHADGTFDLPAYEAAIDVTILAQEVIVDGSSYPTERITQKSHRFRPLGLGYANLGSALMCAGLAYDSDDGRELAAGLTALMGGRAYRQSALIANRIGPFEGWKENKSPMAAVIKAHHRRARGLLNSTRKKSTLPLTTRAEAMWEDALSWADRGYRNSQATVLAPTGTIAFMMDCDTTGIEPDIALRRTKHLVGGTTEDMVSEQVPAAMRNLGYSETDIERAAEQVATKGSVVGIVYEEHLPVFDCAFADPISGRFISAEGHIDMMAATQPFLSGAISKTVNLPENVTVQQVSALYLRAWTGGLKAVALYRDGSKRSQPVTTEKAKVPAAAAETLVPVRQPMPDDVPSNRHKVTIGDVELFIHVGIRPETGEVGEVFLRAATQGTIVNGLLDGFGRLLSLALQHNVPLNNLAQKFYNTRFEPSGFTGKSDIPSTTSILDYVFRHVSRFGKAALKTPSAAKPDHAEAVKVPGASCPSCGATTVRTGSCQSCPSCFWTGGCG